MFTRHRRGRCLVCAADHVSCGIPGTGPSVTHTREEVTRMPDGKLNQYPVTINGYKTKIQLTEDEARKRGLIADDTSNDKPTGRRSARTKTTKQDEGGE
jgi:hypothetical protein